MPSYVASQLTARGFVDIKVEILSVHMPIHDTADFCDIYTAFIEMVTDKYWTEEQRESCRPLIRPALMKYFNAKYGEGKPFTTERVNIMATARKPF
jgi:hypothetical protein